MALDTDDSGAFVGDAITGLTARLLGESDRPVDRHRVIPTGLHDLDEILAGGLRTGQLAVLTGASGVGTSTLALAIARSAAIHQAIPTILYAPETPPQEIGLRILAAETCLQHISLRSGQLTERGRHLLRDTRRRIADAPLSVRAGHLRVPTAGMVHDTVHLSADQPNVRLIVIDGLSCAADLSQVLPGLASAARTHHIGLLITCNDRAVTSLIGGVDLVLRLHAPSYGEAELEIIKHRYGPTGSVRVGYQEHYGSFGNLATA